MSEIEEAREDLYELKELHGVAKRKCSKELLDKQIAKTDEHLQTLLKEHDSKQTAGEDTELSSTEPKDAQSKTYTVTLRTYSWDQSDKFLKLYVTIPALRPADASKVSCTFSGHSVAMHVKELDGKNYQLVINNLAKPIAQERSHWKVKEEMVVLLLSKDRLGVKWPAVTAEEARHKEKNKPDAEAMKNSDPNASIMGLMKKMYDDGDDQMKQMLNKTWYETQMKAGSGVPGMGGMGGMGDMPGMGGMGDMPGMGGMGNMPGMDNLDI